MDFCYNISLKPQDLSITGYAQKKKILLHIVLSCISVCRQTKQCCSICMHYYIKIRILLPKNWHGAETPESRRLSLKMIQHFDVMRWPPCYSCYPFASKPYRYCQLKHQTCSWYPASAGLSFWIKYISFFLWTLLI